MDIITQRLKAYIEANPFDPGESSYDIALGQRYQAYAESHESDPPEICTGFKELAELLKHLPLRDNDAVFNLCCNLYRIRSTYSRKSAWLLRKL